MTKKSFIKTIGEKGLLADYNTEGKKLQTELTAGDNITISANNVISADKQIIFATYGVTPYDEVKSAILNGFDVLVMNGNLILHSSLVDKDIYFETILAGEPRVRRAILRKDNSWSTFDTPLQRKLTFDTEPKAGSKNPVTSDGIKKAIDVVGTDIANLNQSVKKGFTKTTSSDYTSYNGIPANGTATWYVGGGAKHIAVPLIAGQRISVTPSANTNYVFCDSSYVAVNKTTGSTLEVSSRNLYRHSIAANTKTTFVANSDDAYLILVVVTGGGKSVSIDIEIDNELRVAELLGSGLKDCNIGMRTLSQSDYMEYNGSISSTTDTFFFDGNKGKHIDIRLIPNCVYVVKSNRSAFLFVGGSSYSEGDKLTGDSLNLAPGRNKTYANANYPISIVTEDDDKYLILNTINGAGASISWTIECYFVAKKKIAASTKMTSSDFVKHTGIPANGTATWYVGGGAKHIAVPVSKGEVVSIKPNANTNYTFVTSSYIEGDQTNGSTLYVSARNKTRNTIIGGQTLTFTANSDDAYLILVVVNGGGVSISYDIEYKVSGDYAEDFEISPLFKIKYGTWNIGHFSMGTDTITTITPEQKEEKQLAYRNFLNSLNLDVLGVCEDDQIFCTDGTHSDVAIYSLFNHMSEGTKYGYNCNSLYHNLGQPINDDALFFPASSQVRYLHELEFVINGKKVVFAETHLELTAEDRATEIAAIINRYSEYDYVVISGDFNVSGELTELQPFVDAGYRMALMDYMPAIVTRPASNLCIDNIVTKGFAISNVVVHDDSSALSDHLLVSCNLTMLEE